MAEKSLRHSLAAQEIDLSVLRKSRSVGTINPNNVVLKREQLEEIALAAQNDLHHSGINIPFCAFNGGSDVWVDVGNKLYGVQCLQKYFGADVSETIHVGDQFLSIGNGSLALFTLFYSLLSFSCRRIECLFLFSFVLFH